MKGLLLLLSVGAAIYTFLVITHDALTGGKAEDTFAGQTQWSARPEMEKAIAELP